MFSKFFKSFPFSDFKKDFSTITTSKIFTSIGGYNIINLIDNLSNTTHFHNSFINHFFIREVSCCFSGKKNFVNCTFSIECFSECIIFFNEHNFENCTFYISDYSKEMHYLNSHLDIFNANNTIIKHSYLIELCHKYNNNLNKAKPSELRRVALNNSDLRNCPIPLDQNFFKNLSFSTIKNCSLPKIDFNKYNLSETSFTNVVFHEDSVVSPEFLKRPLLNCTLPKINFRDPHIYKSLIYTSNKELNFSIYNVLKIRSCKFHKETIFPKDKTFFNKMNFKNCHLPSQDYSSYLVDEKTFIGCTFDIDAILPEEALNESLLNSISILPQKHILPFILNHQLSSPNTFYTSHIDRLSDESLFVLASKYSLPRELIKKTV